MRYFMRNNSKIEKLDILKNECFACNACQLCKTRNNIVFADGSPDAEILLIGEAPGAEEDKSGIPFVGRAGKLLNQFLEHAGISRENDIYICNTLKCRPPENRVPTKEEKKLCFKFLEQQINIVSPKIIILCGATSAKTFLGEDIKISQIRGKWFDIFKNIKTMVVFHPSYLLRNHSENVGSPRYLMLQDLKEIKKELINL